MNSIVDLALVAVGNTAGDADGRYESLIADGETPNATHGMVISSGCGLVVRGLWRTWLEAQGAGVPAMLRAPYRVGSVLSTLLLIANAAGAVADGDVDPEPGDVVWLGDPEHVETNVGNGWHVAGGERDALGRETVRCVRRGPVLSAAPAEPSLYLPPREVVRVLRWERISTYLLGAYA